MSDTNAIHRRIRILPEIQSLDDGQLIDATMEELWADLDMGSRQSVLLSELLDRFQEAVDLDETPKGITKDGNTFWPEIITDADSNA